MAPPVRRPIQKEHASYHFSAFKIRSYPDHNRTSSSLTIRDIDWNPPGNRIACALSDKLVRVWNPDKPEIRMSTELKGHTAAVLALAWDPTHCDKLASCGLDGTVRFWDYRSKQLLAVVNTGGEAIAIAWHPDGKTVAVATKEMKIHFITVAMYQLFATNVLPTQVHSLIFSHSGATLLMSTATGQVLLYEYPTLLPAHTVDAHASAALCLELDPRGAHLAVGGSDAVMSIWDTSEWICMRTLRGMDAPVRSVSFSFDGAYICAGTEQSDEAGSHDIEIVHVDTGELVHTVNTMHPVVNVKWHPTKYALAYSGDPSGLKIYAPAEK